jgi:hypothetical protein
MSLDISEMVGRTIAFCRLLLRACGPPNFMKKGQSQGQNGRGAERRGWQGSGEVEAVRLFGPGRAGLNQ